MISFLARRTLSTRGQPLFRPFFLFICLLGVSTGVCALIIVLSVMEGFEADFQKKVIGFKAPLTVTVRDSRNWKILERLREEIPQWDRRIERVRPFVEGEGILQTESGESVGVRVRGIEEVTDRFGSLYESEPFSRKSVVLGEELADALRIHPDYFEKVQLIFPFGEVGPTGELLPRRRSFTVSGTFHSGYYDFDNKYLLLDAREASNFLGDYARFGLELWVEPRLLQGEALGQITKNIATRLPEGVVLESWRQQNPKLFAAMKLERIGMLLLLTIFLLIASFNIYGLISLTVLEKVRDLAVLRCLGLPRRKVPFIFLTEAMILGVVGSVVGGLLGGSAVWFFQRHPIRLPTSYYVEFLPLLFDWRQIAVFVGLAPLVCLIAALYPAFQASRSSPVEVLRYE